MKRKIAQGASKKISRKKKLAKISADDALIRQEILRDYENFLKEAEASGNLEEVLAYMNETRVEFFDDGSYSIHYPGEFECSPEFEKIMNENN